MRFASSGARLALVSLRLASAQTSRAIEAEAALILNPVLECTDYDYPPVNAIASLLSFLFVRFTPLPSDMDSLPFPPLQEGLFPTVWVTASLANA